MKWETPDARRLLVIDRDPGMRGLLQIALKGAFEVEQALSGHLAFEMMRRRKYDCIAASLDFPPRTHFAGVHIIRHVRSIPGYENVPLVAMSAEPGRHVLEEVGGPLMVVQIDRGETPRTNAEKLYAAMSQYTPAPVPTSTVSWAA